ncbi:MAG: hypothetical protein ACKVQK_31135 [Burkholderiales bacterium]
MNFESMDCGLEPGRIASRCLALLLALGAAVVAVNAQAQAFASKNIRIVVPQPASGSVDATA